MNKLLPVRGVILCLLLNAVTVCLGAEAAATSADADYAAFQALKAERPPGSAKDIGAEKYLTWSDTHLRAMNSAALAFRQKYPGDARAWELVMASVTQPPMFVVGFRPDVETKGRAAIIADDAAVAAWRRQSEELTTAMLASANASPALKEAAEWNIFAKDFRAAAAARAKGNADPLDALSPRFTAHVARYADLGVLAERASDYLGALESIVPGTTEPVWKQLQASQNAAVRAKAKERVQFYELIRRPLDIAFTAVDGRAVDLRALRGKVVLVDFWATWCGPCIAELPNVKKVYQAYRNQGFEIVGISLENGKLLPTDTPEQKETKLAAAKKILTDFTEKEGMSWPQYFDGRWWKNEISMKYAIEGIPAMFLLDRDGRVASTNARGEKLEAEVKRLLTQ